MEFEKKSIFFTAQKNDEIRDFHIAHWTDMLSYVAINMWTQTNTQHKRIKSNQFEPNRIRIINIINLFLIIIIFLLNNHISVDRDPIHVQFTNPFIHS